MGSHEWTEWINFLRTHFPNRNERSQYGYLYQGVGGPFSVWASNSLVANHLDTPRWTIKEDELWSPTTENIPDPTLKEFYDEWIKREDNQ